MYRRARTSKILRRYAKSILDQYNILKPPIPVKDIANYLGAEVRFVNFEDDKDISGMIIRGDSETIIGVNASHHANRKRFTLAHECGHLLLHKAKSVYVDRSFSVKYRDVNSADGTDIEEIEANRFAAELLMPHDFLLRDVFEGHLVQNSIDIENEEGIRALAERYEVSQQAMTFRLQNVFQDI